MIESAEEKILFRQTMNLTVFRRKLLAKNITLTAVAAGALAVTSMVEIYVGVLLAVIAVLFGIMMIFLSWNNEIIYRVYNDKIVIKRRSDPKSKVVRMCDVTEVKRRQAFYERDFFTATLTVTAKTEKGRTKRYRLYHILDSENIAECIRSTRS